MSLNYVISHFIFPGYSNNHKAKLLHSTTIFVYISILILYQVALQFIPLSGAKILGYAANIPVNEVVTLTNEKRTENGLTPLQFNDKLASAAYAKGEDMLERDYWAHVAPDGTEPWKFFVDAGYNYRFAGENLARDFSNAATAVNAWMASPSHRENLLSSKYQEVGIAVVEGDMAGVDTTIIVQLFGTSYSGKLPTVPIASAKSDETIIIEPTSAITISPTQAPVPSPTTVTAVSVNETLSPPSSPIAQQLTKTQILISPFTTTRNISIITVIMLLSVLVIDAVVTHKRKVPRIGGRTFAHLAFLGMILAIALIIRSGNIL
jgi:hypothetical protein